MSGCWHCFAVSWGSCVCMYQWKFQIMGSAFTEGGVLEMAALRDLCCREDVLASPHLAYL